jgi:hypothetical protein
VLGIFRNRYQRRPLRRKWIPTAAVVGVNYSDTGTCQATLTASATELRESTDTSTVAQLLTASAVDTRESADTATPVLLLTAQSAESRDSTDTATTQLTLTTTAVEFKGYDDAATSTLLLTPSVTETRESADTATSTLLLTHSGVGVFSAVDTAIVSLVLLPSASEIRESTDTLTIGLILDPARNENRFSTDTDTAAIVLTHSADQLIEYGELTVVSLKLDPARNENRFSTDADTVSLLLTPSGQDDKFIDDSGTVGLLFTPTATLIYAFGADTGSALLTLTHSGAELYTQPGDAATALLKLSPIYTVDISENVIVDDYFTRSNLFPDTTLFPSPTLFPGLSTSTTGPTWGTSRDNQGNDGPTWFVAYDGLSIFSVSSSAGRITSIPDTATVGNLIPVAESDVYTYTKLKVDTLPTTGTHLVETLFRAIAANTAYKVTIAVKAAGTADIRLVKIVSGVATTLATSTNAFNPFDITATYEIEAQINGNLIQYRAWKTGGSVPSYSTFIDSSITGPGDCGIRVRPAAGGGTLNEVSVSRFKVVARIAVSLSDLDTVGLKLTPTALEEKPFEDTASPAQLLTASASEIVTYVDTDSVLFKLLPNASDIAGFVDSSITSLLLNAAQSGEIGGGGDQATIPQVLTPSADLAFGITDTAIPNLKLLPSYVELVDYSESDFVAQLVLNAAQSLEESFITDANVAALTLEPSSDLIAIVTDHLLRGIESSRWAASLSKPARKYIANMAALHLIAEESRRWQTRYLGRGNLQ